MYLQEQEELVVFAGGARIYKCLLYLQEEHVFTRACCICRRSTYLQVLVFAGGACIYKSLLYLQEELVFTSACCICRRRMYLQELVVFAGGASVPVWDAVSVRGCPGAVWRAGRPHDAVRLEPRGRRSAWPAAGTKLVVVVVGHCCVNSLPDKEKLTCWNVFETSGNRRLCAKLSNVECVN